MGGLPHTAGQNLQNLQNSLDLVPFIMGVFAFGVSVNAFSQ